MSSSLCKICSNSACIQTFKWNQPNHKKFGSQYLTMAISISVLCPSLSFSVSSCKSQARFFIYFIYIYIYHAAHAAFARAWGRRLRPVGGRAGDASPGHQPSVPRRGRGLYATQTQRLPRRGVIRTDSERGGSAAQKDCCGPAWSRPNES